MKPVKEVLHTFTRGIILALSLGYYFVKKAIHGFGQQDGAVHHPTGTQHEKGHPRQYPAD
jgi:hypothetical protein